MASAAEAKLFHCRPESAGDIIQLAQQTLLRADCFDVLPTPLDQLYTESRITAIDLPPPEQLPRLSLEKASWHVLLTALQKVRGIADLRRRAVYLPTGHSKPRRHFAKAHELGHQLIPWHRVGRDCVDTDKSLAPAVKNTFEAEANLFASEIIFQGKAFRTKARDYSPTFEAVFLLADLHGVSNHATLWKFTEEYDLPIASLTYYRNAWSGEFRLWHPVVSPRFKSKCGDVNLPETLTGDHPWATATQRRDLCKGDIRLLCSTGRPLRFSWESWWNTHALFVLLRARLGIRLLS